MVASNFKDSLAAVRRSEGGNSDDPADHGGRTSRGIIQREYDRWRTAKKLPTRDVWTATDDEIDAIYHDDYWMPWGDKFPLPIDYMFFDLCVNAGAHRATVLLQRALGITDDGHIGPMTLKAIGGADPRDLIKKYSDIKRAFYHNLNQPRFINGWINRCDGVENVATRMISPK